MDMTTKIASSEEAAQSPFGAILRDTISEMEVYEADLVFDDLIQRLSLEAHHAITAQAGAPLPRVGGYAYQTATVTPPAKTESQLDVRF